MEKIFKTLKLHLPGKKTWKKATAIACAAALLFSCTPSSFLAVFADTTETIEGTVEAEMSEDGVISISADNLMAAIEDDYAAESDVVVVDETEAEEKSESVETEEESMEEVSDDAAEILQDDQTEESEEETVLTLETDKETEKAAETEAESEAEGLEADADDEAEAEAEVKADAESENDADADADADAEEDDAAETMDAEETEVAEEEQAEEDEENHGIATVADSTQGHAPYFAFKVTNDTATFAVATSQMVTVHKNWNDASDTSGRPSSLQINLATEEGQAYGGMSAELSEDNGWEYTFGSFTAGYTFSAIEENVPGYVLSTSTSYANNGGKTFTGTMTITGVTEVTYVNDEGATVSVDPSNFAITENEEDGMQHIDYVGEDMDDLGQNTTVYLTFSYAVTYQDDDGVQHTTTQTLSRTVGWGAGYGDADLSGSVLDPYVFEIDISSGTASNPSSIYDTVDVYMVNSLSDSGDDSTVNHIPALNFDLNSSVTMSIDDDYVDITVSKEWDDNNDSEGIRPDTATVYLAVGDNYVTSNGVRVSAELSESNGWSAAWEDVPADDYSALESYIPGYVIEDTDYEITSDLNYTTEGTVTVTSLNYVTYTNEFGYQITIDGSKYQEVTASDGSKSFQYIGEDLTDLIPNSTIRANISYYVTYTDEDGSQKTGPVHTGTMSWTIDDPAVNYELSARTLTIAVSQDTMNAKASLKVVNTYGEGDVQMANSIVVGFSGDTTLTFSDNVVDITVTKEWDDDDNADGNRPDSITVYLGTVEGGTLMTGDGSRVEAVLSDANDWTYTWTGQSSSYNYTVREDPVDGYLLDSTDRTEVKLIDSEYSTEGTATILSLLSVGYVNINGNWVYIDGSEYEERDPEAGMGYSQEFYYIGGDLEDLPVATQYSITFQYQLDYNDTHDVPQSSGVREATLTYSITEVDPDATYSTVYLGAKINSLSYGTNGVDVVLTNTPSNDDYTKGTIQRINIASNSTVTLSDPTVDITVTKVWEDDNPADRPDSVHVYLANADTGGRFTVNGQYVDAYLSAENDWTYTWSNYATNFNYTVIEDVVDGYDLSSTLIEYTSYHAAQGNTGTATILSIDSFSYINRKGELVTLGEDAFTESSMAGYDQYFTMNDALTDLSGTSTVTITFTYVLTYIDSETGEEVTTDPRTVSTSQSFDYGLGDSDTVGSLTLALNAGLFSISNFTNVTLTNTLSDTSMNGYISSIVFRVNGESTVSVTSDYMNLILTKVWDDNSYSVDLPSSVHVYPTVGGSKFSISSGDGIYTTAEADLNAENNWTASWIIPTGEYSATEDPIEKYLLSVDTEYDMVDSSFTATATIYVESIDDVWYINDNGEEIHLDASQYQETDPDTGYTQQFEYTGEDLSDLSAATKYGVTFTYSATYTDADGNVVAVGDQTVGLSYDLTSYDYSANPYGPLGLALGVSSIPVYSTETVTMTNTYDPMVGQIPGIDINVDGSISIGTSDYVDVTVSKTWDDADDSSNRPDSLYVVLTDEEGNVLSFDGGTTPASATLSDANGWSYTWTGLPGDTSYSVKEADTYGYELSDLSVSTSAPKSSGTATVVSIDSVSYVNDDGETKYLDVSLYEESDPDVLFTQKFVYTGTIDDLSGDTKIAITVSYYVTYQMDDGTEITTDIVQTSYSGTLTYSGSPYMLLDPAVVEVGFSKANFNSAQKISLTNTWSDPMAGHIPSMIIEFNGDASVYADNSYADVTVTKTWDDEDEATRPASLNVTITSGSNEYSATLTAENGWSYTWYNIPNGDYTVSEEDAENYEMQSTPIVKVESHANDVYSATSDITLNEVYYYNENGDKVNVDVSLFTSADPDSGFTHKFVYTGEDFTDLVEGAQYYVGYTYTLTYTDAAGNSASVAAQNGTLEVTGPVSGTEYTAALDPIVLSDDIDDAVVYVNDSIMIDITNTWVNPMNGHIPSVIIAVDGDVDVSFTSEYIDITVVKAWDDNEDAAGARPDSITVYLVDADGNHVLDDDGNELKAELSDSNNWTATWTGVANGTYSVEENAVEDYEGSVEVTASVSHSDTYTSAGKMRIVSLDYVSYVNEYGNTVGLDASLYSETENGNYSQYFVYSGDELTDLTDSSTITVQFTYVVDYTDEDGNAKTSSEMNGEFVYELAGEGGQDYVLDPVTVEVSVDSATFENSDSMTMTLTNTYVDPMAGHIPSVNIYFNANVTGTVSSDIIDVSVEKVWDDNDDTTYRTDSVTVYLVGSDGEYVLDSSDTPFSAVLSDANEWAYTWYDLPYDGYSVVEEDVTDYNPSTSVDVSVDPAYSVTGSLQVTSLESVSYVNVDGETKYLDTDKFTASYVDTTAINYVYDENEVITDMTEDTVITVVFKYVIDYVDANGNAKKTEEQTGTFSTEMSSDGAVYDAVLDPVTVRIDVDGFEMNGGSAITLTNTFTETEPEPEPEPDMTNRVSGINLRIATEMTLGVDDSIVKLTVSKDWDDNGNEGYRPDSVTVYLLHDGSYVTDSAGAAVSAVLSAENDWTYTWDELFASGSYSVVEEDVNNYTASDSTLNITSESVSAALSNVKLISMSYTNTDGDIAYLDVDDFTVSEDNGYMLYTYVGEDLTDAMYYNNTFTAVVSYTTTYTDANGDIAAVNHEETYELVVEDGTEDREYAPVEIVADTTTYTIPSYGTISFTNTYEEPAKREGLNLVVPSDEITVSFSADAEDVTVSIDWSSCEHTDRIPDSVRVYLTENGSRVEDVYVDLTADMNWTYTWTDLEAGEYSAEAEESQYFDVIDVVVTENSMDGMSVTGSAAITAIDSVSFVGDDGTQGTLNGSDFEEYVDGDVQMFVYVGTELDSVPENATLTISYTYSVTYTDPNGEEKSIDGLTADAVVSLSGIDDTDAEIAFDELIVSVHDTTEITIIEADANISSVPSVDIEVPDSSAGIGYVVDDKSDVTFIIVWDDVDEADYPDSIHVTLVDQNGNTVYDADGNACEVTVSADDDWTYTWTDVPSGNYTIAHDDIAGYVVSDIVVVTEDNEEETSTGQMKIVSIDEVYYVNDEGNIVYLDTEAFAEDNTDGIQRFVYSGDPLEDLPVGSTIHMEYTYVVEYTDPYGEEKTSDEYSGSMEIITSDSDLESGATMTIVPDDVEIPVQSKMTITETIAVDEDYVGPYHYPYFNLKISGFDVDVTVADSGNVDVTAVIDWDGIDNVPSSVTIYLTDSEGNYILDSESNVYSAVLSGDNNWTVTWPDMPSADYSFVQEDIEGYELVNVEVTVETDEHVGDTYHGTITNIVFDYIGYVNDQGETVELDPELFVFDGVDTYEYTGDTLTDLAVDSLISIRGTYSIEYEDDEESHTIDDLPIAYEVSQNFDDTTVSYPAQTYDIALDGGTVYVSQQMTLTGTEEYTVSESTIDIPLTIIWEDDDNAGDTRPDRLRVIITGSDGSEYTIDVTPDEDGNWDYTVKDLPQYDKNGDEIEYTVGVETPDGYVSEVDGRTITNTLIETPEDETVDIPLTIIWDDDDNAKGTRPDRLHITIKGSDGSEYEYDLEPDDDGNWDTVIEGLPKYDEDGNEIEYEIEVVDPDGYVSTVDDTTITNTLIEEPEEETIDIPLTIIWDDDDNSGNTRPDHLHIKITDSDGNKYEYDIIPDGDDWDYTVKDLPKYNEDGEELTYTIEVEDPDGYTSEVDGNTITNTLIPTEEETVDIPVEVIWEDDDNSGNTRPDRLHITIKGSDGSEYEYDIEPDENGNWDHTFEGFPKYDEDGNEIEYTIEVEDPDGYISEVDGNTITNTLIPEEEEETVDIPITVIWEDDDNSGDTRPDSLHVIIVGSDGNVYDVHIVPDGDDWNYTFEGLPKYDADGEEIEYIVSVDAPDGYVSTVDGTTITNTLIEEPAAETVDIPVEVIWDDDDNSGNTRPDRLHITIKGSDGSEYEYDIEPDDDGNWDYTVKDLPKFDDNGDEIDYSIEVTDPDGYVSEVDGNTITNTLIPDEEEETVDAPVEVIWDDDDNSGNTRPDHLHIIIRGSDGSVYEEDIYPNDEGDWDHTFEGLPKYDENGDEIIYSVDVEAPDGYESEVDGNTITNTLIPTEEETVDIPVTIIWDDDDNSGDTRPDHIHIIVKGSDGSEYPIDIYPDDGDWDYTVKDLPKFDENGNEIEYVIEVEDPDGYVSEVDGNTITNTLIPTEEETVDIPVEVIWDDDDNSGNTRPDRLHVTIKGSDGSEYEYDIEPDENGNWDHTFEGLPKYDENGDEIDYSIEVVDPDGYISEVDGNTITNTLIEEEPETVDIPVTVIWDDDDNSGMTRPERLHIVIVGSDGTVYDVYVTPDENDSWDYTFEGLPKYDDDGNEIEYVVSVDTPDGYESEVDGNTITNTLIPTEEETIDIPVTIIWDDDDNSGDTRPDHIHIIVKGSDGSEYPIDITPDDDGNWDYTVKDLPKFDENGDEIEYVIEVEDPDGYVSEVDGNTITNTLIEEPESPEEETVDIPIKVIWDDDDNSKNTRPDRLHITVKGSDGNEYEYDLEPDADGNWDKTIEGLPKYDENGDGIVYEITVEDPDGYESEVDGNTITNTLIEDEEDETVDIPIEVIWDDNDNEKGTRPDRLHITIKGSDGNEYEYDIEPDDEGNWNYTVKDLPKFDEDGNEIEYEITVDSPDGYESEVDGNTITNTLIEDDEDKDSTIDIPITIIWDDDDNEKGTRPGRLHITITGSDGEEYEYDIEPDDEGNWDYIVKDLPKYDPDGNEIEYKISVEDPDGYISEVDGNTITNTLIEDDDDDDDEDKDDTVDIPIEVIWDDDDNAKGTRPDKLPIIIRGSDGSEYEIELTPDDDGDWDYTVKDLPKYDEDGNEIEYEIVVETPDGYTTEVDGDTIINKLIPTVDIPIEIIWDDDNNSGDSRPDHIHIEVEGSDGSIYEYDIYPDDDGDWDYTIKDLPKFDPDGNEIEYKISVEDPDGYISEVDGDTIINHLDSVDVPITVIWDDDDNSGNTRLDRLHVNIIGSDGTVYEFDITPDEDGNWDYTVKGLPRYDEDGNEIDYIISVEDPDGYISEVDGNTITNTLIEDESDTVDIPITIIWDDNDNADDTRPDDLHVIITGSDGSEYEFDITPDDDGNWDFTVKDLPKYDPDGNEIEYKISVEDPDGYISEVDGDTIINHLDSVDIPITIIWDDDDNSGDTRPDDLHVIITGSDGSVYEVDITPDDDGNWDYTVKGLPKYDPDGNEIEYKISVEDPDGYISEVDGDTIINHLGSVDIPITIIWDDDDNSGDTRPDRLHVIIIGSDGNVYEFDITPDDDGNWDYTVKELPRYDEDGNEIEYKISVEDPDGYISEVDGNTIINRLDSIDIPIEIIWDDDDNKDGTRPDDLHIIIIGSDGSEHEFDITPDDDGNWNYTVKDLPRFDENGDEIIYKIIVEDPDGYVSEVDGNTITNHLDSVDIPIEIIWDDNDNAGDTRPDDLHVIITGSDGSTYEFDIEPDENGDWNYTIKGLPRYDEDGNEIEYKISVENPDGYVSEVDGNTITNTLVNQTKDIEITIIWDDNDNSANTRPDSLKIYLKGSDGSVYEMDVTPDENGNWDFSFKDIPVYTPDGEKIDYTVEVETPDGYVSVIDGTTITNTLVDQTIEIDIEVTWDDDDNSGDTRPDKLPVIIIGSDGSQYEFEIVPDENGDWSLKVKDLPKYDENGNEIHYEIIVDSPDGYITEVDGSVIKNTLKDKVTKDIYVEVVWDDDDNSGNTRPDKLHVIIKGSDGSEYEADIYPDDNWKGVIKGLPAYDKDGNEIVYEITVEAPDGYVSRVDGNIITNTLIDTGKDKGASDQHHSSDNDNESETNDEAENDEESVELEPTGDSTIWFAPVMMMAVPMAYIAYILYKKREEA